MKGTRLLIAGFAMLTASTLIVGEAHAQVFGFSLNGGGVSGTLMLTYGLPDATYPNAYEVTGISGSFSDMNTPLSIFNVAIQSLVPITRDTPEAMNLLAPKDFSRFAVASGLPPESGGFATYDNLFWPAGSPQTASDYPPHGGFLDIYGLFFSIGGDRMVNVWSNGADKDGKVDYGVSVTTARAALDYVGGGVTATETTPEPGSLPLVVTGAIGLMGVLTRRRGAAKKRVMARAGSAPSFIPVKEALN